MAKEWLINHFYSSEQKAKREEKAALHAKYVENSRIMSNWLRESKRSDSRDGEGVMKGRFDRQYNVYFNIHVNAFDPEFTNEVKIFTYIDNKAEVWQYRYAENSQLPSYLLYEKRIYNPKSKEWERLQWGEYFTADGWTFAKDANDKPRVEVFTKFEELTKDLKPFRQVVMHFPIEIPPLMTGQRTSYPRQVA